MSMRAYVSHCSAFLTANAYRFDRVTGVGLAALFVWFAYRHLQAFYATGVYVYLLYVCMESIVVLLALCRQPAIKKHVGLGPLCAAIAGTFLPLTMSPGGQSVAPQLGLLLGSLGCFIALAAYISLNTKFGVTPALRGVAERGVYSFVRHPMYASYFFVLGGYLLTSLSITNALVTCAALSAQVVRLTYEEGLLGSDERYRTYAQRVRWRLIPGVY